MGRNKSYNDEYYVKIENILILSLMTIINVIEFFKKSMNNLLRDYKYLSLTSQAFLFGSNVSLCSNASGFVSFADSSTSFEQYET